MNIDFPSDIHFLREAWLWGLLAVPVFLGTSLLLKRKGKHWASVIAPELITVLLPNHSEAGRSRVADLIAAVALSILVVALAGPSWEKAPQPVERSVDELVIVLDLSYSMFVEDVSPNRISAAKFKITDILRSRAEGYTALVVYAGDAHIVTPLTHDTTSIQHLLASLSPNVMPIPGSDAKDALLLASQLLNEGDSNTGRIVLFTDGLERLGDLSALVSELPPVHVIGVGTPQGGTIPVETTRGSTRPLTDASGSVVRPRLNTGRLRAFAIATGGSFTTLELDDSDISRFYDGATLATNAIYEVDEREYDEWVDAAYLLVIPLLLLACLGLRRGVLVVLPLAIVVNVDAGWFDDLWSNRDRQGYNAMQAGQPEVAAELFEDPDWRGVAEYRRGDYQQAESMFEQSVSEEALFNLGNSLAYQGQIDAAIEAYEKTIAMNPDHEDATFNRDLLQRLKDQQQQQQSQQQQNSGQGNPQDSSESAAQQDSQNSSSSAQPQSDSQAESDPSSQSQQSQTNQSDTEQNAANADESDDSDMEDVEKQKSQAQADGESSDGQPNEGDPSTATADREAEQALERMLRRVSEDSGDLLKNKFRHDSSLRLNRGEITRRRSDPVW